MECEANPLQMISNIENFDPVALSFTRALPFTPSDRPILKDITSKIVDKKKTCLLKKNIESRRKVGGLRWTKQMIIYYDVLFPQCRFTKKKFDRKNKFYF